MEELLNKLIEKGWKPFGITCTNFIKWTGLEGIPSYCFSPHPHILFAGGTRKYRRPSLRQIVSKESGLWQFVCENRMVDGVDRWTLNARQKSIYDKFITSEKEYTPKMNYEYRIIESALCNEEELEQFLLDNIKIS